MQFLLDCSVLPLVISATQTYGPIITCSESLVLGADRYTGTE